eukprot:TRINITY_DN2957_c5_g1_i1.p1 TRINITY_DN2957_c5_g1~~TRINITY_DN2957_c5_g1_i1.p1  ORF type:complete len:490 (+),score=140.53 TRINITY_DN2957_c5_g1_i1:93-1562(+)
MSLGMVTPLRRDGAPLDVGGHKELAEVMTEMFDAHLDNRNGIDSLMKSLREAEGQLQEAIQQEADCRADVKVRQMEADKLMATQDKKIATLDKELQALVAQRDEKDKSLHKLEADLQGALARVSQSGHTTHDAEQLLQQLQELEEREKHLRKLENRLICCEELRLEGSKTLEALRREHDQLGQVQGQYYQGVRGQMEDNQRVADQLTIQLKELTDKREHLLSTSRETATAKQQNEELYQQLTDVKAVLEADLKKSQTAMSRGEQELNHYMSELLGHNTPPYKLFCKMEETMMLLKAAAINLDSDHAFIGEINEKAGFVSPEIEYRGLQSFCDAFRYIKGQVECHFGVQPEHERWILSGDEIVFEEVEPLLSALKQLVTCYDMMPDDAKLEIPFTKEIIRNSSHLLNLIQETALKYQEIENAREEELRNVQRARDQKKRERLAKKYAPKQRDPYSRAPATQLRSSSIGTAFRGVSNSYAAHERDLSPVRV